MRVVLVMNKNFDSAMMPFSEKFRVFADPNKAVEFAVSIGWDMNSFMGPPEFKLGFKLLQMAGEKHIEMLLLEVAE